MPPRSSLQASNAAARRPGARVVDTPTYLPLQYLLSGRAIPSLQALERSTAISEVDTLLKSAISKIHDCAFEINELATQHGSEQDDFKTNVDQKSQQLDHSMRRIIDCRKDLEHMKSSLNKAVIEHSSQQNATTQRTQTRTQTQTQRSRQHGQTDDDEDDDEIDGTNVTALTQDEEQPRIGPGPSQIFKDSFETSKEDYQALSLHIRYSQHPDYVSLKNNIWEGKYPNGNGPPLPHPSTWFTDRGSPAPGMNTMPNDDDDLQTIGVTISTKDPLTLQPIQEPVRSTKCTHHYEKASITNYIRTTGRQGRPRGAPPAVQCPVSACNKVIGLEDLVDDPILARKIKRKLEADQRSAMLAQNGGIGENTEVIDDEDDDDGNGEFDDTDEDEDDERQSRNVKAEIRSSRY